jgi:putative cell wall-binding protein/spore germination protein YaaH
VLLVAVTGNPTPSAASAAPAGPSVPAAPVASGAPLPEEWFAHRLSGEVYGFLPYWEIDGGTDAYLRYDLLTDIALFSVTFTASGTIATSGGGYADITSSTVAAIVEHAHAAGVRVDLTVTSFGFDKNAAFFGDPTDMATAVGAISAFVQSLGLDGVNLDVESLYSANFTAYGTFVGQLRAALRSWNPAARVSAATNGSVSGAGMAVQALANGADRVFMMGYNFRSSGSSPAGSIAPIVRADGDKSLTWTLDLYASKGVPADRILLGLPYYGRTWHTTSGTLNAPTTSSHGTFVPSDDMASVPPGTVIGHDPVEGAAWFAYQDATGTWHQTYFDDPVTLRAKYDLASGRRLAGIGIWTLGYDQGVPGYWEAISAAFGTVRIAGADRYATAAAVAGDAFVPGVALAYVATGTAFPDALAAAAAAGVARVPVLLVTPTAIPAATASQLARLQPARIIVVGGPGAVSDAVLAELNAFAPGGATRIFGQDRFATAAAVSAATFPSGAAVAYVTTGTGFADAVSAAPAAARDGAPVLLTGVDLAPPAMLAELARLAPARVVIVGGLGAVSDGVLAAIQATLPFAAITRLAGADRYATSAAVAATFPAGIPVLYAASGLGFPDAIAAAAAAGSQAAPMVLTDPVSLPASIRDEIIRLGPARAVLAGGIGAVSEAALAAIRDAVATR